MSLCFKWNVPCFQHWQQDWFSWIWKLESRRASRTCTSCALYLVGLHIEEIIFYCWLSHIHACGQCESIVSKPSLDTQMKSLLLLAKYWEKHHEVVDQKWLNMFLPSRILSLSIGLYVQKIHHNWMWDTCIKV